MNQVNYSQKVQNNVAIMNTNKRQSQTQQYNFQNTEYFYISVSPLLRAVKISGGQRKCVVGVVFSSMRRT